MSFTNLVDGTRRIDKAPAAVLRYGVDVRDVLDPGDVVVSASVSDVAGVLASDVVVAGTVVSAEVSGGEVGIEGRCTLRWATAMGYTDERTLRFRVMVR